ncbi:transcription factor bHLH68-like isoform X2 [Typha angustifolia]|uniref:transcription factor bHLH68-like isoform X2 n=1 Tax=Typha angustifolia TaxID=59011 RepID=UPI003C2CF28A
MNREMFQGSLLQQMIGGNPTTWWNMNNLKPPTPQEISQLLPSSSSSSASSASSSSSSSPSSSIYPQYTQPPNFFPSTPWQDNQDHLPESWSQLLLGGLVEEEERCSFTPLQPKRMDYWESQLICPSEATDLLGVKQENCEGGYMYQDGSEEIPISMPPWNQALPASSTRSCITTNLSSKMLDFSSCKAARQHQQSEHSSECNSSTGSAFKKARVQTSTAQSPLKVRKEKLGDRITVLHQIVSPFGKTDTASVLQEAIGYIRFLQGQIEALSLPYLGNGSKHSRLQPMVSDTSMSRRGPPDQDVDDEPKKDLRSRGLCLVPVSLTLHVGNDNGADYWAPAPAAPAPALGDGF